MNKNRKKPQIINEIQDIAYLCLNLINFLLIIYYKYSLKRVKGENIK